MADDKKIAKNDQEGRAKALGLALETIEKQFGKGSIMKLGDHAEVLVVQDIREIIPEGIVINDHDVLIEPKDIVKLHKIMKIDFNPIGKHVVTVSKEKVGKVVDYALDADDMYIHKLYVSQPFFKHLATGNLSVDRSQIQEITTKKIIIQDLLEAVPFAATA